MPPAAGRVLDSAGFVVAGAMPVAAYDRLVPAAWQSHRLLGPTAAQAVVVGTGGGEFERSWRATAATDPADTFARDALRAACTAIETEACERARSFLYSDQMAVGDGPGVFADFVALAEACGLGQRSRLGLLLHSRFGPWWSVRGLIVTSFGGVTAVRGPSVDATPCHACAAPCAAACPGNAILPAGFDAQRCAATRLAGADCQARCDARRACVIGSEHAYAPADEAHYAESSLVWIRRSAGQRPD